MTYMVSHPHPGRRVSDSVARIRAAADTLTMIANAIEGGVDVYSELSRNQIAELDKQIMTIRADFNLIAEMMMPKLTNSIAIDSDDSPL